MVAALRVEQDPVLLDQQASVAHHQRPLPTQGFGHGGGSPEGLRENLGAGALAIGRRQLGGLLQHRLGARRIRERGLYGEVDQLAGARWNFHDERSYAAEKAKFGHDERRTEKFRSPSPAASPNRVAQNVRQTPCM